MERGELSKQLQVSKDEVTRLEGKLQVLTSKKIGWLTMCTSDIATAVCE